MLARLGLRPGQRILVVGSGGGWLTLPLARAVGEGGRVVYLAAYRFDEAETQRQAAAQGLGNLEAFYYPEQAQGLPGQGFEVVLLFDFPSENLGSPAVAARLASWVAPGGRLGLLHSIPFPDFCQRSFWSPADAWATLCALGPDSPLVPLLEARGFQLICQPGTPPEGFGEAFLPMLNGVLESPPFYRDLNDLLNRRRGVASEVVRYIESDARVRVLQWVDANLGGVFVNPPEVLSPLQREAVRAANHTVVSGLFHLEARREDRFLRRLPMYRPETLTAAFVGAGLHLELSERPFCEHLLLVFSKPAAGAPKGSPSGDGGAP